ncbi:MAG: hypothetical protein GYB53_10335 [Rhodobacteraceae bacterium]|nr:hypothetical protein [Paracoccaceae bacterium]MBR9820707.1 hypothetical protein [Paracoccaceae bacterium]
MKSIAGTGAFIRNMSATLAAVGVLCTAAWVAIGPRVTEWALAELGMDSVAETLKTLQEVQQRQQGTLATISQTQAQTAETLNAVVDRIAALEKSQRDDRVPPIRFLDDSMKISSGRIGQFLRFEFQFVKSRDCGRPVSDAFFVDGDGISHAFADKSSTAEDGRSISAQLSSVPAVGRFTARIPADQGVTPTGNGGFARGYILISWPDCPNVAPLRSPTAPFQIFP